jgi:hypothetical protein
LLISILLLLCGTGVALASSSNFASGGRTTFASGGTKVINATAFTKLGMNYGNKDVFASAGAFSTSSVTTDLANLYTDGFRFIRIALPDYTNAVQWQHVTAIATVAHADGFNVMCGASSNPTAITTTNESTWMSGIIALAPSVNGLCDIFAVGNEEEYHNTCPGGVAGCAGSLTDAQIRTDVTAMAASVKSNGFPGKVVYSVPGGQTQIDEWTSNTSLGALDTVCFNLYGERLSISPQTDTSDFRAEVKQAVGAFPNACVSEFNLSAIWSNFTLGDTQMANNVAMRVQVLRDLHFPNAAYFFTYTNGDDSFAAKLQNGTFRGLYAIIKSYAQGAY